MTPMSFVDFVHVVGGIPLVDQAPDVTVTGVAIDHRQVQPGDAFVAFVGQRVDGHQFVDEAFRRGASVAVVTKDVKTRGPSVRVPHALQAVQALARWERAHFDGPVVGITGSNGKTTTKEMVAAVLTARGPCVYTSANQNNELGLPLTILQREASHRAMVLEMGMRGLGQIEELCLIARPNIGVITHIGYNHIELLGSQENIALAKTELIASLPQDGVAVLNGDDPWLRRMQHRTRARILWYGMSEGCEVRATSVDWSQEGMSFKVETPKGSENLRIRLLGQHNVMNALAAVAVGQALGISLADIQAGLGRVEAQRGRLRLVVAGEVTVIDDAYNASPSSVSASLEVLERIAKPGHRVAVLGDMLELGEMAGQAHREVGRKAASAGVDRLLCVGELAIEMARAAQEAGVPVVRHFPTLEQLLSCLGSYLEPGDVVLVKASRAVQLDRAVNAIAAL
ncbi:UDP-N-acetylmuramoyl-tripeptide--D-alanyl-D-alanine ligase [Alicyclobacillus sendaiensis]|uniref:UDP-N-acetylmuramoyl-tripeptide--D-alanyl-D-alanine ligase n=1 Tax=Alicyclobacillus sendaiensis PA2 TaxID=3029425 RepID=A0ABT6Y072_ALISE|nr:UDP-N-acetylmuramoyl-tripeptide--D-alanyl-D-alanine ligase [Alicyclobacillus sendaiensis]MDI9260739.1 UDP-N-acetylmuramoyl-tripeptide--D-alanyl-D-alanine ligase [Alicyclobacillus sendaiensis PA2]